MSNEEWRPVVGYEGYYEVSDLGRVKRVKAVAGARAGRLKQSYQERDGYLRVCLMKDGQQANHRVHGLVAAAFIGPRHQGAYVNHLDGDKTNCKRNNLEYTSPSGNAKHALQTGLRQPGSPPHPTGERNHAAKLTAEQVMEIRASRETNVALAGKYAVSDNQISWIRSGKKWAHLPGAGENLSPHGSKGKREPTPRSALPGME